MPFIKFLILFLKYGPAIATTVRDLADAATTLRLKGLFSDADEAEAKTQALLTSKCKDALKAHRDATVAKMACPIPEKVTTIP